MAEEKNYITSSAKRITTQYGELFSINIKMEDLVAIEKDGWVSITMAERKTPSEKGATHYLYQNKFEPKKGGGKKAKVEAANNMVAQDDDLPF